MLTIHVIDLRGEVVIHGAQSIVGRHRLCLVMIVGIRIIIEMLLAKDLMMLVTTLIICLISTTIHHSRNMLLRTTLVAHNFNGSISE